MLSPKERLITALELGQPDRVPITAFIYPQFISDLMNCPIWKVEDIPYSYEYQIKSSKILGLDTKCVIELPGTFIEQTKVENRTNDYFIVSTELKSPTGSLNLKWRRSHDLPTWQLNPMIKDESEIDKLQYVISNLLSGWKSYSVACSKAKEKIGDEGIVGPLFMTPAAWAAYFARGIEHFVKDLYDNMNFAEKLMELGYEYHTKIGVDVAIDSESDFINLAWNPYMNPKFFEKYEMPYLQKEIDRAHKAGLKAILLMDGRANNFLELAVSTGADAIEPLDPPTLANGDIVLRDAKEKIGKKISLIGNVDTINVLLQGSRNDVEEAVKQCIIDAAKDGGYILSTSEYVCKNTPMINMETFVSAGLKYGKYPIQYVT
ncbi:uroporphyrinogen decarboxylase family protein [Thermoproteota archaeon]